jgi:hypothetical protein
MFWHVILWHCERKIKTEGSKRKADIQDELLARVLDAAASRNKR